MARVARVVVPGVAHHVTQRGNRRERTFFEDADYKRYRTMLGEAAKRAGAEVWAYCLMPNHVHLIVVPADEDGLRRTFADAHRRYTGLINARHQWTGHLRQGRFGAVAMDEPHLMAAARYIALNPVRAKLVSRAEDWPWSSVRAHLAGEDDGLVTSRRSPSATRTLLLCSRKRSRMVPPGRRCASRRAREGRSAAGHGSRSWSGGQGGS